jgi:hypothetical protein
MIFDMSTTLPLSSEVSLSTILSRPPTDHGPPPAVGEAQRAGELGEGLSCCVTMGEHAS